MVRNVRLAAAVTTAFVVALLTLAARAEIFADSAKRSVELPAKVDKVLPAGPPAAVVLYTLAPEKMLGWVRVPDEEAQAYLMPRVRPLPAVGRITGRNAADPAAIKALSASVIVDFGDVNANYAELANRTQAATDIPYVLIDGTLKTMPAAYRSLGKVVQAMPRAGTLAAKGQALLDEVSTRVAAVGAADRKRVYIARGPDGNETYGAGAFVNEMVTPAGGTNVADAWGRGNLKDITPDKVREANPDIVIVLDPYFLEVIAKSAAWKKVPAIAAGRVYVAPHHPWGWLDEPPSVNRLIGLRWLAEVLHRERFDGNLRDVTRDFYRTFYQVDLNGSQLDKLLAGSQPAKP